MGKKTIESYKAPWEVDAEGADVPEDEQVIDKGKLKRYLFGLISDKETAQEARDAAIRERDEAKTELDRISRQNEGDDEKRQREQQEAQERDRKLAEAELENLRLKVALRQKGITAEQAVDLADRLRGTTEDELDKDAKAVIERFGLAKSEDDDDEDDDGDEGHRSEVSGRPRSRVLRTPGDPEPGSRSPRSLEDELASIPRPGGVVGR